MSNPNRLTTKEVARICKVSDATVKRWAAAGIIDSEKTNGGHRRFSAEDVARFQSEQGLGASRESGDNSFATATRRAKLRRDVGGSDLFRSMICGCDEEVANFLIQRHLEGEAIESIFDTAITKELERVGELWVQGKVSVADEHLASRSVAYALYKIRTILPKSEQKNKLAVCCSIEGDFHGLAVDFGRMVFESCGWSVLNFGANTPLFSLQEEMSVEKPDILCISAAMLFEVDRLTKDFEILLKMIDHERTKVIVAGRALDDLNMRKRFPADFYPRDFRQLAEYIRSF